MADEGSNLNVETTAEITPIPEESYVVHGALIECTCGSRQGLLIVPLSHGVYLKEKAQLKFKDSVGGVNIQSMGVCSAGRDALFPDKAERKKKGFLKTVSDFFFGKKSDEELEEMAAEAIKLCEPETCGLWLNAKDNTFIGEETERALLSTSTITCLKGGIITIANDGQDEIDYMKAIDDSKKEDENITNPNGNLEELNEVSLTFGQMAMNFASGIIEPVVDLMGDKLPNFLLDKLTNGELTADEVGAFMLMMDRDEDGVYHARTDCWQRFAGYTDLYDVAFDVGTDMDKRKLAFEVDGNEYVLWAWKGDYVNLGSGSEFGIYAQSLKNGFDIPGKEMWLVDRSLSVPMEMELKDNKGNIIADYKPNEEQWWITSFNPAYKDIPADELTTTFTIDFSTSEEDKKMYEAIIKSNDFKKEEGWSIVNDSSGNETFKIKCEF